MNLGNFEHDGDTVSGEVVNSQQGDRKELTKRIKHPYYNMVGLLGWWRRQVADGDREIKKKDENPLLI